MPPERRYPPSHVDCKWWLKGHCTRGQTCYFKHDEALRGSQKEQGQASTSKPSVPSVPLNAPEPAASTETAQTCAICYEAPDTYGLLVNCDHAFCLECIRNWRATAPKNPTCENELKKTSKTCPMCRLKSDFIVPSSIWPSTQKKEIVDSYLARMKTIPCRYFEDSARKTAPDYKFKCQFGNHCHYSHTHPVTKEPYTFSPAELKPRRRRGRRVFDEMAIMEMLFSDLSVEFEEWVDGEDEFAAEEMVDFFRAPHESFGYDYGWE